MELVPGVCHADTCTHKNKNKKKLMKAKETKDTLVWLCVEKERASTHNHAHKQQSLTIKDTHAANARPQI